MGIRSAMFAIVFLLARPMFGSVGFQRATVPDSHGKPIAVGIWYPSGAEASSEPARTLHAERSDQRQDQPGMDYRLC